MPALFVSATGTDVGKTHVTRAIARAMVQKGIPVAALKPIETGCQPVAMDARALARACQQPDLEKIEGFWRASEPLAPISLPQDVRATLDLPTIIRATKAAYQLNGWTFIEGAGGVAVPIDEQHDMMDFAAMLALPILIVARDGLGVLSYVRTATAYAQARGLEVVACVLSRFGSSELSYQTNADVLRSLLDVPVFVNQKTSDDDDHMAAEVIRSGLLEYLLERCAADQQ